jgi:hypothetical protein
VPAMAQSIFAALIGKLYVPYKCGPSKAWLRPRIQRQQWRRVLSRGASK